MDVDTGIINSLNYSRYEPKKQKAECLKAFFTSGEVTWEKVIEAVIAYPPLNWRVAK